MGTVGHGESLKSGGRHRHFTSLSLYQFATHWTDNWGRKSRAVAAQEELIMPKLPLAATAVASILVTLATGSVAQMLPPNLPLAIICFNEKTQTWRIGYLDVVAPDGSATYVAGDLWATVNAKGLVQPPSNRSAGVDCFGKTLDDLRAAGRVMEFKRSEQKSAQRDRQ